MGDEWPEQIEHDPRWEVQPEPDDDPGSNTRAALVGLVALVVMIALIAWGLMDSQPAV